MATKKVSSHVFERIITVIMLVFGVAAIWIFASASRSGLERGELAIIMILLIVVLAILAQTVILVRIYEKT